MAAAKGAELSLPTNALCPSNERFRKLFTISMGPSCLGRHFLIHFASLQRGDPDPLPGQGTHTMEVWGFANWPDQAGKESSYSSSSVLIHFEHLSESSSNISPNACRSGPLPESCINEIKMVAPARTRHLGYRPS